MEASRTTGADGTARAAGPSGADRARGPRSSAKVPGPAVSGAAGPDEPRRTGPLIVTEDLGLLDDLLRLCAAAGVEPEVHHRVPERRASWTDPPLVLVGDDVAAR